MQTEHFLTTRNLEARLQLHRNTIHRMLVRGDFPNAFKTPGGRWRIPRSDFDAFVQNPQRQDSEGVGR